jgi:hypothetical protein
LSPIFFFIFNASPAFTPHIIKTCTSASFKTAQSESYSYK